MKQFFLSIVAILVVFYPVSCEVLDCTENQSKSKPINMIQQTKGSSNIKSENTEGFTETIKATDTAPSVLKEGKSMQIKVESAQYKIIYKLNQSQAAADLYAQLPLTLEVENFSTNEKIFYPPEKLGITDTPLTNAKKGTLAYYSPWANVVMFYDDFGRGSSLYELGEVVSGKEDIEKLNGTITITAH